MSTRRPRLRRTMIEAPWVEPLIADAAKISIPDDWDIEPVYVCGGHQLLAASGRVSLHTDEHFPQWCYVLVLAANKQKFYHTGHERLTLRPRMLVEFDAHTLHGVDATQHAALIWHSIDSDMRISLPAALELHRLAFSTPGEFSVLTGFEQEALQYWAQRKNPKVDFSVDSAVSNPYGGGQDERETE